MSLHVCLCERRVYSNRAACYAKLMDWERGLADCDACLKQDPTFVKAYIRQGKIYHFLKQGTHTLTLTMAELSAA